MRLIDESTLKKSIEKWLNPDQIADRMVDLENITVSVMMEIEEQPTAYDVDKVVAELESIKRIMESPVTQDCFAEECKVQDCTVCIIDRAIQIVKGGGIDGYFKGSYISLSYGKYKGVCR